MKKLIAGLLITTLLVGCGRPIVVDNKEYPTYGLFNENTEKSKNMCYEVSVGNVVWSILGIETIIMPIYFIGFSLFNPIGKKINGNCGIDVE